MTKTNKLKASVILALAICGVAFPTATILSNRPATVAAVKPAPTGTVEIGDVVVLSSTPTEETPAPAKPVARHTKRTTAKAEADCRMITLEQQGRPGARQVRYCEGAI